MVTYATFIICLASAFIAGGVVAIAWRILTEKDGGAPSIREDHREAWAAGDQYRHGQVSGR